MKNLFSAPAEVLGPLQAPHQIQAIHRRMKSMMIELMSLNEERKAGVLSGGSVRGTVGL